MVERVFHKVADGFNDPITVTEKGSVLRTGESERLLLLLCAVREVQRDILHHVSDVFRVLFKGDGARVEPCYLEQVLHESFDAVKLLLGQFGKLFHSFCVNVFVLQ